MSFSICLHRLYNSNSSSISSLVYSPEQSLATCSWKSSFLLHDNKNIRKNNFKNQYEIYFGLALNEGKYAIQMKDLNNAMTSIFDNNSYSNKSGDTGMFITNCVDYLNNKIF